MMKVSTIGLSDDTKVWIDNIHMDTSIVATQKMFDGIIQDSMDDRIHNSLMLGFPISNEQSYYGINQIEGQSDSFIQGTFYGMNGYESGSVEQKRYLESDYLEKGVYANHIGIIYGLLIQGPNDKEPRGIDVYDDIYVKVYDTVEFDDDGNTIYRTYSEDGSYKEVEKKVTQKKKK